MLTPKNSKLSIKVAAIRNGNRYVCSAAICLRSIRRIAGKVDKKPSGFTIASRVVNILYPVHSIVL
jgi:hypothetical protein